MQILPTSAATSAAGNVAQATNKDRGPTSAGDTALGSPAAGVERLLKSEGASPDRDAQGAGDGLADRQRNRSAKPSDSEPLATIEEPLPVRAPEPPSQIDLIG